MAAAAVATSRIGLIATCSTTYTEPFNLARPFGSLDHISNGRIGWNIVTTWLATAAANFGTAGQASHADRYDRAEEYMTVVKGLWDFMGRGCGDRRTGTAGVTRRRTASGRSITRVSTTESPGR